MFLSDRANKSVGKSFISSVVTVDCYSFSIEKHLNLSVTISINRDITVYFLPTEQERRYFSRVKLGVLASLVREHLGFL